MAHNPDRWCVMKYSTGDVAILSGWSGGYLQGDQWRRSSKVEMVSEFEDHFMVQTQSSEYILRKNAIGMTGLMMNIAGQANLHQEVIGYTCEFITEEEDAFPILRAIG